MNLRSRDYGYEELTQDSTGTWGVIRAKTIEYPFGRYEVTVLVSEDNRFLGILEVKVKREFVREGQKVSARYSWDVDRFYAEE